MYKLVHVISYTVLSKKFIAATGARNWKLHLAKMKELLPYFHAHDQYNYGYDRDTCDDFKVKTETEVEFQNGGRLFCKTANSYILAVDWDIFIKFDTRRDTHLPLMWHRQSGNRKLIGGVFGRYIWK